MGLVASGRSGFTDTVKDSSTGVAVGATQAEVDVLDGAVAGTGVASKAVVLDADKAVAIEATRSTGSGSFQPLAVDMKTGGAVGGAGKKLAPIMGHVVDLDTPAAMTAKNIVAGLIGAYGVTADQQSTYPCGAVLAQISDLVNDAAVHGVVSYIDGDSGTTKAGAMFKVMCNNSTAASGADWGLDLQDAAHDGYVAVDRSFYKKAPLRLVDDVVFLTGAGAPTDGGAGTGLNVAGIGSLYFDVTNGNFYIQTTASSSPTWKLVTRAA